MKTRLAPWLAVAAIVLWASLAMTSSLLKGVPPFFQLAVAFTIGGLPVLLRGRGAFPPVKILLLGVAGFYGYHFFLFTAFRLAPPVAANLVNYLWPMLMVLLSPLFFKEAKLTRWHYSGAALSLLGVLILMKAQTVTLTTSVMLGYLLAAAAAFTWPTYSLLKKRTPATPVMTTAGVCLVAGVLSWLTHFFVEPAVTPTPTQWWLLLWLGVGPFGAAFFLWDVAVRSGDPRTIGALSYLTPVLSTILLVFGAGEGASIATWCAMGLMTLGSILGTLLK